MTETTTARFVVERAETRDEYWYVKNGEDVVALFFSRRDAEAYATWRNEPKRPLNGAYAN